MRIPDHPLVCALQARHRHEQAVRLPQHHAAVIAPLLAVVKSAAVSVGVHCACQLLSEGPTLLI